MNESNILLYETDEGKINVDVILKDEIIWLTQKSMSELFDVNVPAINKHLNNIYEEKELDKNSTISKMEIVRKEGNRNVNRELEFLGLEGKTSFYEKDLEQAIIDHLQKFLLELGRGFSFVSRQQKITFDGRHFFIDLVFYNYILKCFVIIDLKLGDLTHQDIGQMQMYVNYYTREMMNEGDNPPIGIVLCADKSEQVVKYTLPEDNNQIFASKYKLYLPTEEEFKKELNLENYVKKDDSLEDNSLTNEDE